MDQGYLCPTEEEAPAWYAGMFAAMSRRIDGMIAEGRAPHTTQYQPKWNRYIANFVSGIGFMNLCLSRSGLEIEGPSTLEGEDPDADTISWRAFVNMTLTMEKENGLITAADTAGNRHVLCCSDVPLSLYRNYAFFVWLQTFLREQPTPVLF